MGRLTTHILDLHSGRPAQGVKIDLLRLVPGHTGQIIHTCVSNADGRTQDPLLSQADYQLGQYELHFHIGDYFARLNIISTDNAFLDVVPIRFKLVEPQGHYHVPLLTTPWAYSTYRGS